MLPVVWLFGLPLGKPEADTLKTPLGQIKGTLWSRLKALVGLLIEPSVSFTKMLLGRARSLIRPTVSKLLMKPELHKSPNLPASPIIPHTATPLPLKTGCERLYVADSGKCGAVPVHSADPGLTTWPLKLSVPCF